MESESTSPPLTPLSPIPLVQQPNKTPIASAPMRSTPIRPSVGCKKQKAVSHRNSMISRFLAPACEPRAHFVLCNLDRPEVAHTPGNQVPIIHVHLHAPFLARPIPPLRSLSVKRWGHSEHRRLGRAHLADVTGFFQCHFRAPAVQKSTNQ